MNGVLSISELVIMWLNDEELNVRQTEQLKLWLSDSDNLRKLEEQFRDPDWLTRNLRVVDQVNEIDHWRKFMEHMQRHGQSLVNTEEKFQASAPIRRIGALKYAAAAAFLFAVLGGSYLVVRQRATPTRSTITQAAATQDLPPGGNKAVLTLANGSKILLDSAANGDLAEQGKTKIIKLGAGQLSYRPNESGGKLNADSANTADNANNTNANVLYNTITTPAGGQYQVALPDGSKVWLNAASSLRFPTAFKGSRKVQVSGEAYFEIAKDAKQPFIVESGERSIAVLGTSFNVNAYPDEPLFAVSLVNGSVRVKQGSSQETLHPGQQAQMAEGGIWVNDHVNLKQIVAWKDGLFKFYNSDIHTVMREIGRWYNVSIVYEGKIPEDRFTGTMDKSLNASDVLKILALSKVHFRIEGRRIVVMPD